MATKKVTEKVQPIICQREGHEFFQLTHYSIGQATLGYPQNSGAAKIVCRKCGQVLSV